MFKYKTRKAMKRNQKSFFLALPIILLIGFTGCQSYRQIPYLQESDSTMLSTQPVESGPVTYDARIMPNDLLTITVNTVDKEAAEPFNLIYPTGGTVTGGVNALQKYLVDNNGYINFPTVGMIHVQGKTRRQAEELILNSISRNFKEKPIIIVSFADFKVTVVGEVKNPGTFTIENEKVNILQALSLAGDMTIYGKRNNVKIFREHADGTKEVIQVNLNDRNMLHSQNYYLQQNDVLYVEPNKSRAQAAEIGPALTIGLSSVGILISITNLIINLAKK